MDYVSVRYRNECDEVAQEWEVRGIPLDKLVETVQKMESIGDAKPEQIKSVSGKDIIDQLDACKKEISAFNARMFTPKQVSKSLERIKVQEIGHMWEATGTVHGSMFRVTGKTREESLGYLFDHFANRFGFVIDG